MGVSCNLYLITPEAFAAAAQGAWERFDAEADHTDIDRAWHAISYLVTGKADPPFLDRGVQIANVSEHCEAHASAFVADLSQRLHTQTPEMLLHAFNAGTFNEDNIYPGGWDESSATYLAPLLDRFLEFIHRAAREGKGVLAVLA